MNKVNGYDAIIVRGTPRFRLNNKLVARESVPEDVQQSLIAIIQNKDTVRTVAPAPDVSATFTEEQPTSAPVELDDEPADNPYVEAGAPEEYPPVLDTRIATHYTQMELELIAEVERLKRELVEPTKEAVPTDLTAQALGEMLHRQYGVYTALAPIDPQVGDIHPFTLKPMNRYDVGLAYVERKKSVHQEVSTVQEVPLPQANPRSNGGFQSFEQRTGVSFGAETSMNIQHHTNDPINEEATAEPNLRGTTIRPIW